MGTTYLIHFDRPYRHARHYLGHTELPWPERIQRHRNGNGARLLQALDEKGIGWQVVRTWPDTPWEFEQRLKAMKNSPLLCPVCNPDGWEDRGKCQPNEAA